MLTTMLRRWIAGCTAACMTAVVLIGCGSDGDQAETGPEASAAAGTAAPVRVPEDVTTLGEAADRVAPGGTILIGAGHYAEQLLIDTPDVTVRGVDRNDTVIDGGGIRPYGVVAVADGVRVENITVTGATFYGVLFTGLHDENGPSAPTADGYQRWDPQQFPPLQRFRVDHVTAFNNGLYGIYAFNSQHGVITDSYASGSADSGFYVGQCRDCDVLVTGNVAERNAVGFENANASDSVVVAGNRFAGNRVGLTLLSSYQEAFLPQHANQVVGNLISDNDEADSPAQADGGFGTGIGIGGGQSNTVERNRISGNARAGVILTNTEDIPATDNRFRDNVLDDNAVDMANQSAERTPATGNCATGVATTLPTTLLAELSAACDSADGQPQASTATAEGPDAPPGKSFKQVTSPIDQPNLAAADPAAASKPLPGIVAMPDLTTLTVPAADLLQANSGTR